MVKIGRTCRTGIPRKVFETDPVIGILDKGCLFLPGRIDSQSPEFCFKTGVIFTDSPNKTQSSFAAVYDSNP